MTIYQQLQRLGIKLPDLAPTHEFLPVNIIGDFVFVSGMLLSITENSCTGARSAASLMWRQESVRRKAQCWAVWRHFSTRSRHWIRSARS